MITMKELHQLKGNPDLSHWSTVKLFSIAEAALLTAGIEPFEYNSLADYEIRNKLLEEKPRNWQHALMLIRSMMEAICTHEIKSPSIIIDQCDNNYNSWQESIEQAKISIDDIKNISFNETKIHRDELKKWLKNNGYFEQSQQNTITVQQVVHQQSETVQHNNVILLPEPTYTTPALDALYGVIDAFWKNYDPNNNQPPPKQSTVASWIKANYPEIQANDICTYIDKICRHPKAKTGGNKKINTP